MAARNRLTTRAHTPRKPQVNPEGLSIACVDLFCGAGGLTYGLRKAGIPVVAGVDLDSACRFPYEKNNRGAAFIGKDISTLSAEDLEKLYGTSKIRVLAGCAPCQPFSSYAQRYDTEGTPRWALLREFARLVRETLPDVVTMENVPAVVRHSVFEDLAKALEGCDYHVWFDVVDAADFGLPQRRRRAVLIASRLGPVTPLTAEASSTEKRRTVRDAIKKMPRLQAGLANKKDPLHSAAGLSKTNLRRIQASRAGGTWRDWPKSLVAACHQREKGKTYPGVYGRMEWDKAAPTLTTQFFGFGSGRFGHPSQDRALSLREGAVLQGFPKTYSFVQPGHDVHFKVLGRLIGNAVPVDLARAIGKYIRQHIEAHAKPALSGVHR